MLQVAQAGASQPATGAKRSSRGHLMDEQKTPKEKSTPPNEPPEKDPVREAEQAADAKAEEIRASVQSKVEQGKSSLGFLAIDSEDDQ